MFLNSLISTVEGFEIALEIVPIVPWRLNIQHSFYRNCLAWFNGGYYDLKLNAYCFNERRQIEHFASLINDSAKYFMIVDSFKRVEKDQFVEASRLWKKFSQIGTEKIDLEIDYYAIFCPLSKVLGFSSSWQSSLIFSGQFSTITDQAFFSILNPQLKVAIIDTQKIDVNNLNLGVLTDYLNKTEDNLMMIAQETFNRYCQKC